MKNFEKKSFLIVLAAIIFYVSILMISDVQSLTKSLENFSYSNYPIIFSLIGINILLSGFRYHFFLKKINVPISIKQSLIIFISGLSMIISPGTSGSLIKSYIIKKKMGISFSQTSPIVLYEKWIEFVAILSVMIFLLLWIDLIESMIVILIGIPLAILFYSILRRGSGIKFVNRIVSKIPPLRNMMIAADEFKDSIKKISEPKTSIPMFLLTIITKINTMFAMYLIFQSFGINFDLFQSGQIFFTSQLIGIFSFIPGGVVVTEASLIGLIVKHEIEFATASLVVIVIRFFTLWLPTIIGFIALWRVMK